MKLIRKASTGYLSFIKKVCYIKTEVFPEPKNFVQILLIMLLSFDLFNVYTFKALGQVPGTLQAIRRESQEESSVTGTLLGFPGQI
jgi:hypothetical protein